MKHVKGRKSAWVSFSVLCLILLFMSCTTLKDFILRGTVVDISGSDVCLCVGYKDGAAVGQEYNAYRIIRKVRYNYEKRLQGRLQIAEVIDEHFSKAKVISGTVEKDDVVERVRP